MTLDDHGIERLLNFQFDFDYIKVLFYNEIKSICRQHYQEENTPGIFFPGLRRGDAPLLTHMSTVENKTI